MNLIEAVQTGLEIKREKWSDGLTVQSCDCHTSRPRPHSQCPEPSLMFPDYVDPKLTVEDILANDWVVISPVMIY